MEFAMDTLRKKLRSTGMDEAEINHILAKFLYEEAFGFVAFYEEEMNKIEKEEKEQMNLIN